MIRFLPSQRWTMTAVALAAGLLAAWAARQHIQGRIEQIEAESRVPTVARVVAAYDLPAGTRLDGDYVAVRDIPAQWAASGTLSAEDFSNLAGNVLTHAVQRGDPIMAVHLAKEKQESLSRRVQAGRRAITIPVDDISSLSGMLQAGDLLDLYVSFEHRRRRVTAPLLQGVLVLATGHQSSTAEPQSETYSTITLDAGPEDAVKLVAARQAGSITAILRHHRDGEPAAAAARGDLASLLGIDAGDAPPRVVPVLYGDQQSGTDTSPDDMHAPATDTPAGLFDADVPGELVSARRRPGAGTRSQEGNARHGAFPTRTPSAHSPSAHTVTSTSSHLLP